jgi:hypothetical protein
MRRIIVATLVWSTTHAVFAQQVMDGSDLGFGPSLKADIVSGLIGLTPDPYSAQIIKLHKARDHDTMTCGMVNLKGPGGGYVGFTPFYYDSEYKTTNMQDISYC